jgi:hypothetical protein
MAQSQKDFNDLRLFLLRDLQQHKNWARINSGDGVVLRYRSDNEYRSLPEDSNGLVVVAKALNSRVNRRTPLILNLTDKSQFLMTVHSALFEPLLSCWEQGGNPWLDFDEFISCSRPQQQAAFVKDEQLLYLWHDENIDFITYATQMTRDVLDQVIYHHWRPNREPAEELTPTSAPVDEACGAISFRRPALAAATQVAVTLVIVVGLFLGLGARQVAIEITTDRNWRRLGFVAIAPMQIWLLLVRALSARRSGVGVN